MTCSSVPAALVLVAAMTAAGSAFAAPLTVSGDNELVTAKVTYVDADLRDPRGSRMLAFRIRQAASDVCGGDSTLVRIGAQFQRCRDGAVDRALNTLSAPMVAQALGRSSDQVAMAHR